MVKTKRVDGKEGVKKEGLIRNNQHDSKSMDTLHVCYFKYIHLYNI